MSDLYSLSVELPKSSIPLADLKGKTLLFVNVASKCGFTPQYKDLEELHQRKKDQLSIIGFPCNQFGTQEPGTSDEILQFCQANYGVTFPIARKADVNGPEAQPIWAYLKEHAENGPVEKIDWNFSKFVIYPDGKIRYFPARGSKVSDIEAALNL